MSQLGTYSKCGEAYYLEKIVKAPQVPAAWFIQGTAFHSSVEEWENSGRTLDAEDISATYFFEWDTEFQKYSEQEPNLAVWRTGGRVKPEDDIARRKVRGHQQVMDYLTWAVNSGWSPVPLGDGYANEVPFDITLGGIRVIGSIDQVMQHRETGAMIVRDLKTGTSLPATPIQLGVYNVALQHEWGFAPGWGDFYMAKNTAPTAPYDLSVYTDELLGERFSTMDRGVQNKVFLPNPGDACRTCGVSLFCSEVGTDKTYSRSEKV